MRTWNLRKRLYLLNIVVLLAGLGSSAFIYLAAGNYSENVLGYEIVGGSAYPVAPQDSKKYVHDLELYGGKANVLADEFISWFTGLWHGKSLAFTVACITILVSLIFFIATGHLPTDPESDARHESGPADNQ